MKVTVYSIYDICLEDYEYEIPNVLNIDIKVRDGEVIYRLTSMSGKTYSFLACEFRLVVSYE